MDILKLHGIVLLTEITEPFSYECGFYIVNDRGIQPADPIISNLDKAKVKNVSYLRLIK